MDSPATLVPLDLRDFAAIDRLGEALYRRWGRLDALVGNAGVLGVLSPLHHVDPKEWDDVMAVNVTANWRLIRSLDPLLRRSPAGRVAFVTSGVASRAELRAYWGPYATSKAALDAIARTYAAETINTSNIRVMLVNPGPLRTLMRAKAMPGEDPMTLRAPEELAPKIVEICSPTGRRRANCTTSRQTGSCRSAHRRLRSSHFVRKSEWASAERKIGWLGESRAIQKRHGAAGELGLRSSKERRGLVAALSCSILATDGRSWPLRPDPVRPPRRLTPALGDRSQLVVRRLFLGQRLLKNLAQSLRPSVFAQAISVP